MLKVNGLQKSYGEQVIFADVSFSVNRGERVGLVGRNGHGKTTLFRLILGEEEPDSGEISVPRHYRVGHLSQHIRFTRPTVLEEACLSLPESEDGIDQTYRVKAILTGLGIPQDYFGVDPLRLSGGYQVRLNLARALCSEPNLLLLDEPTNYLDIVSVRWLKRFLRNWKSELMIITHDREFMDSVTTHTMAIHRCDVKKVSGPTDKLYAQISQEEEIYEQTRLNDEKKRKEAERFINRFRAQATKASAVQSRIKALEKREKLEELVEVRSLDFGFNCAPFMGKFLMEAKGLSFGFDGASFLFEGLSFAVGKKDRIAVIGKNGKGKTTLLNVLAGEFKPSCGELVRHQAMRLAYFGQTNIERLDQSKTVEEEVMSAHPDHSRGAARSICGAMMFDGDRALKKIEVLSGGEKSRVLLGKLLVSPANILFLDEPTNHLDMQSIDSLIEAIKEFDGAVVIVTHSEMILHALANRLIVFDGKSASLFEGSYADFLEKIGWEEEAALRPPVESRAPEKKGANRKELRKVRAELLSERNKVIGPIQKRIAEIEDAIVELEKEAEQKSQALLAASEKGDPDAIASLSKSYHGSKSGIDSLFDELESLSAALESKSKEYEERLNSLE